MISTAMNRIITAFCWMLVHSLWQGLVLIMITFMALTLTKAWKAAARYNLVLVLFTGFLLACLFTFGRELANGLPGGKAAVNPDPPGPGGSALLWGNLQYIKQLLAGCGKYCTAHASFIVLAWLVIFAGRLAKMLLAFRYNQQISTRQATAPDAQWTATLARLCDVLQIHKTIVLLQSGYMKMPVVLGHLKPLILIPVGLLSALPAYQVELILLHELAHIRRNDYLVNIFQHIAENIFFFNPAVWWISSWLREERENCCDDIAIGQTQNKQGLAEALISFKQHELYGTVYHTAFMGKKNHLLRRVSRILGNTEAGSSLPGKLFSFTAFIFLLAGTSATLLLNESAPSKVVVGETRKAVVLPLKLTAIMRVVPPTVRTAALTNTIIALKKTAIIKKPGIKKTAAREPVFAGEKQPLLTDQQVQGIQAKTAQAKAVLDQQEALYNQQLAMLDQEQAKKNQLMAMQDLQKAKQMHEQAMRDQTASMLDKQQAENDQQETRRQKAAERKKMQEQSF